MLGRVLECRTVDNDDGDENEERETASLTMQCMTSNDMLQGNWNKRTTSTTSDSDFENIIDFSRMPHCEKPRESRQNQRTSTRTLNLLDAPSHQVFTVVGPKLSNSQYILQALKTTRKSDLYFWFGFSSYGFLVRGVFRIVSKDRH